MAERRGLAGEVIGVIWAKLPDHVAVGIYAKTVRPFNLNALCYVPKDAGNFSGPLLNRIAKRGISGANL